MHEKTPTLKASVRDRVGSRYADRFRKQGKLPAVVYGHKLEPLPIAIDSKESITHFNKGEKVFKLELPAGKGGGDDMVLLKDVQFDFMGNNIVHADFARVTLDERIHTKVHITLVGEAIGMKQAGAILMRPSTEIEIECKVRDIPDHLEVPIHELDMGHTITADKVKLPKADMKLVTDTHAVVAQIVLGVELKIAEETAVTAEGAEPEVIGAKKEGEEGAAAAAPGAKPGAAPAKGAAPAAGAKPAAGAAPAKGAAPAAGAKPAAPKK
jgi:large subunit ribosomal protein L25